MNESPSKFISVTISAGSADEACRVAGGLIDARLAACVQIVGPVLSVYRWQGKIEESQEWLLHAKSRDDLFDQLVRCVKQLHSYDCPEIVAVPLVQLSKSYAAWLAAELSS